MKYDVIVIGAGPAGLAAALEAEKNGAKTLLVEREAFLGGILKQCIHSGFGLVRFGENLSGPEYAHKFISKIPGSSIHIMTLTFVSKIVRQKYGFELTLVGRKGLIKDTCQSIVLACGCRERTSYQAGIHGRRSAGILTAGTAQYYTNILGKLPGKRCVILGSGDIGLIMARRLTLEGANVLGVYEAKAKASGLLRNVYQCIEDNNIPLYTNKTVTRVFGEGRLKAVEVSSVNDNMEPIPGTEEIIECDSLILSVGLIPENELAESLGVALDVKTKGPIVDQNCLTMSDGVYCCGNALHVNDLVDYVSENGETAGKAAARHEFGERAFAEVKINDNLLYVVPQKLNVYELDSPVIFYFRSKNEIKKANLNITVNGKKLDNREYSCLRPPEMERLKLNLSNLGITRADEISFSLTEVL